MLHLIKYSMKFWKINIPEIQIIQVYFSMGS